VTRWVFLFPRTSGSLAKVCGTLIEGGAQGCSSDSEGRPGWDWCGNSISLLLLFLGVEVYPRTLSGGLTFPWTVGYHLLRFRRWVMAQYSANNTRVTESASNIVSCQKFQGNFKHTLDVKSSIFLSLPLFSVSKTSRVKLTAFSQAGIKL